MNILTPRQPAGVYIRELGVVASINQIEKLFENIFSFLSILIFFTPNIYLADYRTGTIPIIYPLFINRGFIKQVLSKLRVDPNSEFVIISIKNFNNIVIRGNRNSLFLKKKKKYI